MTAAPTSSTASDADVSVDVSPRGALEVLSQVEVEVLRQAGQGNAHDLFRRCALAVLNTGNETDDAEAIFARHAAFDIQIKQRTRGVQLRIEQAPATAFVDGRMIEGIKEHLFSVLRDVVYITTELTDSRFFDLQSSAGITNAVFHVLRNANALRLDGPPNMVVCWGGHSISREEYDYSKAVGYELGLRRLDVCTGCGPGAMKGPMKGAAIGHGKQRVQGGRYLGFSEPGIIAAEPPNPLVNSLVVLPDIEKRLEAFVRAAHAIIVFPGGAGTAEEILYLLGILLHPANRDIDMPLILTGPEVSRYWLEAVDEFLVTALGEEVREHYELIVGDPPAAARAANAGVNDVRRSRRKSGDAFYYNWLLDIPFDFQRPFEPTHEAMAELELRRDRPIHALAADLRRAFSGIVAGNVKEPGVRAVRERGPFQLRADATLLEPLDALLRSFVAAGRMKLNGEYTPCYELGH
ncbi:MAG: nucleotide 5'-monophosphate nucleosidase PpnN [Pseudomonadales bacterium]|jgi:predicted Rossmann-fold nucleotide-binding protein|nr:nucleotide 5'-monophosphate nucleosidase PpnN [Pseudomonadales bacterium]